MVETKKEKIVAPSTIEAIRMASISVLGTTTRRGYPIGSAVGSGSMLEQNSDAVAMNITPLIFSIHDSLYELEDLDILAIEWDLEHKRGEGIVPEQLLITSGGILDGASSYVCALGWEKRMIDPFRMEAHLRRITKKIADIEHAIEGNKLDYENEGLVVLRRFNDRFNRVLFVDLLDRQFQRTWDSINIKIDDTDVQAILTLSCREDFTKIPPGLKILNEKELQFRLPNKNEDALLEHFKHRLLTPAGLEAVAIKVPKLGQALLAELNSFAFAIEESEIAKTAIECFKQFAEVTEIALSRLEEFKIKSQDFVNLFRSIYAVLQDVLMTHSKSGKTLTLQGHISELSASLKGCGFEGMSQEIAERLLTILCHVLEREFPRDAEFPAWQMKSVFLRFLLYHERVAGYFSPEFAQFLLVAAVRKAFLAALQDFHNEMSSARLDTIGLMLFEKFYLELYSQLNAIFDRMAFHGSSETTLRGLVSLVAKEMIDLFSEIDMWDLIEFTDVAEIARTEINAKYGNQTEQASRGQLLHKMLDELETMVSQVVPDIAQTLLSKAFLNPIIEQVEKGADLVTTIKTSIDSLDKPDVWKDEAKRWLVLFESSIDKSAPLSKRLLTFQKIVHKRAGTVVTAGAVAVRVAFEASQRQKEYDKVLAAWEEECRRIELLNAPIIAQNKKREELIQQAQSKYASEFASYEAEMRKYQDAVERRKALGEDISSLIKPTPPEPLESRIAKIEAEYPQGTLTPLPPKPEPPEDLLNYTELSELLTSRITQMDKAQEEMERIFALRLRRLEEDAEELADKLTIELGDEFYDYLLDSIIRLLGRLLPVPARMFLRDPNDHSRVYLVHYEHKPGVLTVTIGDTKLR